MQVFTKLVVTFILGLIFNVSASHLELGQIPNIWKFGQKMDLYIYASKEPLQSTFNEDELVGSLKGLEFGKSIKHSAFETLVKVSSSQSPLYLHLHIMKSGVHPDPLKSRFDPLNGIYKRYPLLKSMKRPSKRVNLLKDNGPLISEKKDESVPYIYPDITINLVNYDGSIDLSSFAPFSRKFIYADRISKQYYPIAYFNELWELKEKRVPLLDDSIVEIPIRVSFSSISLTIFSVMTYFDFILKNQESIYGEHNEFESIKKMFIETSPWLIAVTFVVSLLHSLFDFLAFKNDVQFWRNQKDLHGLSVRGILINSLFQFIIFFYLLDSETSWIILLSIGIGALIEFWKLTRVFEVRWKSIRYLPFVRIPSFHDRASYAKSQTKEYDSIAIKYLTISAIPLLIGYSIWSLKYREHKSWYSWLLRSLVGFVYTFGFISMTPQLFVNYKLKSVAHMPWRAFTYKALNTFIDDLFAFVIKMPWMHRIACFRDDVLFLVYLYQMWIYPVDMNRANEFGQVFNAEKVDSHKSDSSADETEPNEDEDEDKKAIRKRRVGKQQQK